MTGVMTASEHAATVVGGPPTTIVADSSMSDDAVALAKVCADHGTEHVVWQFVPLGKLTSEAAARNVIAQALENGSARLVVTAYDSPQLQALLARRSTTLEARSEHVKGFLESLVPPGSTLEIIIVHVAPML